jgi:hypothetical protein
VYTSDHRRYIYGSPGFVPWYRSTSFELRIWRTSDTHRPSPPNDVAVVLVDTAIEESRASLTPEGRLFIGYYAFMLFTYWMLTRFE